MITRPDYPSFGNWVVQGATTLWEDFEGNSSLNHHFYGDFTVWFMQGIVGLQVNPTGKDPAEIYLAPQFISSLDEAEGFLELPAGKVSVRWHRSDGKIKLELDAPNTIRTKLSETLLKVSGNILPEWISGSFTLWV